ncbi:hypothetical protein B9N63_02540 [Campylobacter concisus]|uniref:WD40 repeat domain-containing protein n=1 Tax=Campylobacter concisus TaxID=199 RepID=UPI000B3D7920|nr:WD40 repeat domain-containing protein [Campylobacter concisus]OUT15185.1 hypothetical protein B9N63_02540 [Campylobacter concisus]
MANLINLASGDHLNLHVEGQILVSESFKNGKTRQTQKEFASIDEAQKACAKKEWESLKKGYVLQNADAKAGEVTLHIYIGGGYTGALAFVGAEGELFVYKCGGYKEEDSVDFLTRLGADGAIRGDIVLPKPLAWHAERAGENLLLDLDHDIFKFNLQMGEFTNVFKELKIKRNGDITSFICASGKTVAFAAYGQIYLLKDGVFSSLVKYETDSGCGAAFCIALSTDGMRLALSCKQNEIKILSTLNGEILNEIKEDFGVLSDVCFLKDGSLLGREYYEGGLVCFDAAGSRQTPVWMRDECAKAQKIRVSADGSRLALISYDKARIVDLKSGKLEREFSLEHIVRRCEAKFERINGEEFLAVRTDYGCFSLYKI